jgi:hypothetical protein
MPQAIEQTRTLEQVSAEAPPVEAVYRRIA